MYMNVNLKPKLCLYKNDHNIFVGNKCINRKGHDIIFIHVITISLNLSGFEYSFSSKCTFIIFQQFFGIISFFGQTYIKIRRI